MRDHYRLAIDIGGTFTDFALQDVAIGDLKFLKIPSTPRSPPVAVIEGVRKLIDQHRISPVAIVVIIHGTTIVTNTILEGKGARTALVTTEGFRDILEIQRQRRAEMFNVFTTKPRPLIPRFLRRTVRERISYDGTVITHLSEEDARSCIRELKNLGVESIAICLLHSYANPVHEEELERIGRDVAPQIAFSTSSSIIPQIREYERMSTTVVNAYVQPVTKTYLTDIASGLFEQGVTGRLYVVQSAGGLIGSEIAERFPVRMTESGPAAGVLAAKFYGGLIGQENLISFDMGGTTAKCCLILAGQPSVTTQFEIGKTRFKAGYPIQVPVTDLVEIGSGGGSVARVEMGLIKVGPQSVGAEPGPACYDMGGEEPTVTDADLVLGYLNKDYFLGGKMKLDPDKARKAITEKICKVIDTDLVEAARGVCEVVDTSMVQAMRTVSVERGHDPRMFTLVAFGGAGPVHVCNLASKLKIPRIVVPMEAGVTSAVGMLVSDATFDFVRSYVSLLSRTDIAELNRMFREMEEDGAAVIQEANIATKISMFRRADMRYEGQKWEITVPVPAGELSEGSITVVEKSFRDYYKRLYGVIQDIPVEVVNLRLLAVGSIQKARLRKAKKKGSLRQALKGRRKAYSFYHNEYREYDVYDRYELPANVYVMGPAIVEERVSTAVISPRWRGHTDSYGNLVLEHARVF